MYVTTTPESLQAAASLLWALGAVLLIAGALSYLSGGVAVSPDRVPIATGTELVWGVGAPLATWLSFVLLMPRITFAFLPTYAFSFSRW